MDKLKVRFHRGGLEESMATMFEPKDWQDFCDHCKSNDEGIITQTIKTRLYYDVLDTRIGWDKTWIITAEFNGESWPIGFANGNIMSLKK